jgi:hypothetical protein
MVGTGSPVVVSVFQRMSHAFIHIDATESEWARDTQSTQNCLVRQIGDALASDMLVFTSLQRKFAKIGDELASDMLIIKSPATQNCLVRQS